MKFLVSGADNTDPGTTVPTFNFVGSTHKSAWHTTQTNRDNLSPAAMNLLEMVVRVGVAPGAGNSRTFAVYKNGAATTLAVTISDTAVQTTIMGQSIAYAAGDTISFAQTAVTGTPAATTDVYWSILAESVTTDYFNVFGGSGPTNGVTAWQQLQGGTGIWETVQGDSYQVVPLAGNITAFYVESTVAPGTGTDAWDVSILKNGTASAATVHYGAAETGIKSWAGSVALAAGDTVGFETLETGTAAASSFAWSATIAPTTPGESFILYGDGALPSTTAVNYEQLLGSGNGAWNGTESLRYATLYTAQITGVYAIVGTAPGAGKSWTFTLNEEGAGTAAAVTIADTATTGNASFSVNTTAGNRYTLKSTPSGTPAAMTGGARVGFKVFIAPDAPPTPQRYNVYANHAVTRAGSY